MRCDVTEVFLNAPAGVVKGVVEPLVRERFTQVVERVHLEGALQVLVVRRNEDDLRAPFRCERFEQRQPAKLRHLDIEEDEIWPFILDRLKRFDTVRALSDDVDAAISFQE